MSLTRVVKIKTQVAPLRSTERTRMALPYGPKDRSPKVLFAEAAEAMASAHAAEPRRGMFLFAAHARHGLLGRMWLEATPEPRAAVLGRHDAIDFALPLDDSLSLRHVLFLVREGEGAVHFWALDLESSNGMQLDGDEPTRLLFAHGPTLLQLGAFTLFCLPSGEPLPWTRGAPGWPWTGHRERRSKPGTAPSLTVGEVELKSEDEQSITPIQMRHLERGVLVGRDERCTLTSSLGSVSRVHAVLLELDGEPYLVDTGSTNGTWVNGREIALSPLADGAEFDLGSELKLRWRVAAELSARA
ncbi:MAG: hypothetical protein RL653_1582 [Pseudomonadota bacterium]|jgi:hypothetical protein